MAYDSKQLLDNIKLLLKESGLRPPELGRLAKIPPTTIYTMLTGNFEPKLSILCKIADFYNINVSQLIGEIPLNYKGVKVPIISWDSFDATQGSLVLNLNKDTRYISVEASNGDNLFAIEFNSDIYSKYKKGSILVFAHTNKYINGDTILISINKSEPGLKKAIVEANATYLKSLSEDVPLMQLDAQQSYVFGVLKEVRIPQN